MARALLWAAVLLALVSTGQPPALAADAGSAPASDPGGNTREIRLSGPDALQLQAALLAQNLSNTVQLQAQPSAPAPSTAGTQPILLWVALILAVVVAFRQFVPQIAEALNARSRSSEPPIDSPAETAAQEKSFAEFAAAFASGPASPRQSAAAAGAPLPRQSATAAGAPLAAPPSLAAPERNGGGPGDPFREFATAAKADLAAIRSIFSKISRAPDVPGRQPLLAELARQLQAFKAEAALPALLPVWQMASAMEGLAAQLVTKPEHVTPSTLRTIASALDLLSTLSTQTPKPDLASVPPVRLLAVDDDALCRHAVSFSLRKVFTQPDLAENGESALRLAEHQHYDVIFLDVEMPAMDGFELCARIHATAPNATTPVIFITKHNEFSARAASCATGGQDLIAKPFLPFEVAVKGFTTVIRRRLQTQPCLAEFQPALQASPRTANLDA